MAGKKGGGLNQFLYTGWEVFHLWRCIETKYDLDARCWILDAIEFSRRKQAFGGPTSVGKILDKSRPPERRWRYPKPQLFSEISIDTGCYERIKNPVSSIQYPVSSIQYPASLLISIPCLAERRLFGSGIEAFFQIRK